MNTPKYTKHYSLAYVDILRTLTLAYRWQNHLTQNLFYNKEVNISHTLLNTILKVKNRIGWDFPGGVVVKNPPANAGDTGLSPSPGRSHMPWSN